MTCVPLRNYIAKDDPNVAITLAKRMLHVVSMLSEQPAMGRQGRVPGDKRASDKQNTIHRTLPSKGQCYTDFAGFSFIDAMARRVLLVVCS